MMTDMRILTAALEGLFQSSKATSTGMRMQLYLQIAATLTDQEKSDLIAVLTEGAMRGPNEARSLAELIQT